MTIIAIICFIIAIIILAIFHFLNENSLIRNFDDELKIIRQNRKIFNKQADSENKTLIDYSGRKIPVYTDDNAKHVFVCGTTGSGKTVALSNYIKKAIDEDFPLVILDGKGDIGKDSIIDIVKRLKGNRKLYLIDMNNSDSSSKYNPFKNASTTIAKDMLINMNEWSEEHYKVNTERYLEKLISLLIKKEIPLSLESINEYMPPDKFKQLSSELVKIKKIDKWEHTQNLEFISNISKIIEGALARFSLINESEIGSIFDDNGIDIYTAIKERSIILFVLNPLIYPELATLIGKLILIDSKKAVSMLYQNNEARVFYVFDEINVYASPNLINLINKSRSANVTCILATQSLADLEYVAGDAFKQQLIENCNNYIVMRQNSAKSSEEWSKIIGTRPTMEVTYKIEQKNSGTESSGYGSAKRVREFIFHPDEIKALKTGDAFYISRDNNTYIKLKVNKPF